MMARILKQGFLAGTSLLTSSVGYAHTSVDYGQGFYYGLLHPVIGADHLLALFAVGLLTSRCRLYNNFTIPLLLMVMITIGATTGMVGSTLAVIEFGIAVSLLLLGAILAIGKYLPAAVALIAVSLIGILHGYAHGREMLPAFNTALYFTGFLLSSLGIQLLGLLIGRVQLHGEKLWRFTGALVSLIGVAFLGNNL